MLKRTLNLLLLIGMGMVAQAQGEVETPVVEPADSSVWQYEYWIDSDYSGHTTVDVWEPIEYDADSVEIEKGARDIAFDLDVSGLAKGIHFLNYRANMHDEWSSLGRYIFYLPATDPKSAKITEYQYWIDNNSANKSVRRTSSTTFSFTPPGINIAYLKTGVHYFNLRARNNHGEWSSLARLLFYKPDLPADSAEVTEYQYWIDDDFASHVTDSATLENEFIATMDISELPVGIHFFNIRARNTNKEWSSLARLLFYIPDMETPADGLKEYEYWIDDDYTLHHTEAANDEEFIATLDISDLSVGVHYFNFRAKNTNDKWSSLARLIFYNPELEDTTASMKEFEYWLDNNYAERTNLDTDNGDFVARVDISQLSEGAHYFNFRAKNTNEVWSALLCLEFKRPDEEEPTIERNDTIIVPEEGWRTYASDDALDLSHIRAYIIASYDGDMVYLSRVTVVPPGTGLVIKEDAGTYVVPVVSNHSYVVNMLKGVTVNTTVYPTEGSFTNFLLGKGNRGVGFYRVKQAGTLAANHAYLRLPTDVLVSSAKFYRLVFDDQPTDIDGVETQDVDDAPYYDLQGRRYESKPTVRGVYMHDGKKVVVK
ncbi:MAG: hypothetical protein IKX24_07685 [Prevotella sp.]|nr:hypothetical protein [Prevotella sp.]